MFNSLVREYIYVAPAVIADHDHKREVTVRMVWSAFDTYS